MCAFAQTSHTYHKIFGQHDGFDIDVVRAMNFDEDGFLWLGGENLDSRKIILSDRDLVLQRFNGNTFHTIQLPKLNEEIVRLNQIYKRKDGLFYLRVNVKDNKQRIILFNPISMEFQESTSPELIGNAISKVFNYENEEYVLIQKGKEILLCKVHPNLSVSIILTLKNEKKIIDLFTRFIPFKNFFLLTDNHLDVTAFDWDGKKLKDFSKKYTIDNPYIWIDEVFVKDGITYVFFYKDSQLYFIDEKTIEILPVSKEKNTRIKNKHITALWDNHNNLIVSKQEEKLSVHSFKGGEFKKMIQDVNFENVSDVHTISNHAENELWITTEEKELHYYKLPSKKVKTFLEDKSIRSIQELNDHEFIVATENQGWFVVNIKSQEVKPYKITQKGKVILPYSSRNIFKENNLLWSNHSGVIFKKSLDSSEMDSTTDFGVISMERLNDSTLVCGTKGHGLYMFNTKTKKRTVIKKIDSLTFYDIAIHNNVILGATDKGLFVYNFRSKKDTFYTAKDGLKDDFLLMADYNKKHGFLLGSRSGKIISFDENNKEFTTLYEDELNAGIATMIANDNKWWIHTFKGFVAYDLTNKTSKRFGVEDGFSNNEANRYSALKTREGVLVGTIKGLNYFNPKDLEGKKSDFKLVLLGVRKYDKKVNKYIEIFNRQILNEQRSITIPSENRALELDFSVTSSSVGKLHTYRYRLNNENWVNLKSEQTIRFANLSAGKYNLEIEALDFSNKKIAESLFLEINSKKFFYKTWWFYLILSLFSISFLTWILKQSKEKNKLQEKFSQDLLQSQEEERTRIARELHDSVGQQLTLIKRKSQNSDQEEITVLTNNALEEVRSISRGLYPALLKQLGLTESIEQLVNEYDEQTDLFFSMDLENVDAYLSENTSLNFYRLVQECLTNIVKHAKAKSVTIHIKKQSNSIITLISDNGKGFDVNEKKNKNSLGLKTIFERIRIMNGNLSIDSKLNNGTSFIFSIPVKNES